MYYHNINTFLEPPIHDDTVPEIIQTPLPLKLKRKLFSDNRKSQFFL